MVKVTYKGNMQNLVHQPPIPVVTGWWRILSLVYINIEGVQKKCFF